MATELLIENVYLYPVLYQLDHRDYKNIKKKDRIWETIAKELNEPSDALKRKWKNLRDSYMKYLTANKQTTGQEKKPYAAWKWSAQMERFRPFVTNAKTQTNVSIQSNKDVETPPQDGIDEPTIDEQTEEEQGAEDDPGQEAPENAVHVVSPDNAKLHSRKRKLATVTNTDKVIKYFESRSRPDMDELDHMMIGFAKTIKKLSRKRQIIAKKLITDIVTELELEELDDCSSGYSLSASAGSHSDMVSPSSSSLSNTRFSINQDTKSHNPLRFLPLTEHDIDSNGDEDCSMTLFNSLKKL